MHVLIIAQQWEPDEGTPQRRWAWLTKALTAEGHTVAVVTPPPHYPTGKLTSTDPAVQVGAVAPGGNQETVWRTGFREHQKSLLSRAVSQGVNAVHAVKTGRRAVGQLRPDVIIATAPPLPAVFSAALLARGNKIPLVVDLRDVWPDLIRYLSQWDDSTNRRGMVAGLKSGVFAIVAYAGSVTLAAIIRRAFAIVTTTPSFSELLRKRGYRRTLSVRNLGATRNLQLGSPTGTSRNLTVLYAGTIGRAQGLSNVIKAATIVTDAGIDLSIRFVGAGAHLETLKKNAEERGLPIEFTGRIPYDDVIEHYRWADTVLIHLEDWEPLEYTVPSKMYEALEIGRHITMSASGEAARIIVESAAGDVVEPMNPQALADLWIDLANNRDRLNVVGRGQAWLDDRGSNEDNATKFVRFLEDNLPKTQHD